MEGEFLLEIGTEEIPAGYLENGLQSFQNLTMSMLREHRVEMGAPLRSYGTPRRLILMGRGLPQKQEDMTQEITGPPKAVACDQEGRPTKAAEGFAKKQCVSLDELSTITTPKGEYLYLKRQIVGRSTREILAENLPKVVEEIPWPKTMRWGDIGFSFVRPIHWILALFDGEVIPFSLAGIHAGSQTFGHRFLAPDAVPVSSIEGYLEAMKAHFVMIDQEEREKLIREKINEVAGEAGGIPGQDDALLSTVANLVEYPSTVCGGFDKNFLRLPDPVLITPMKEHQKYFPVYDGAGKLLPNFIAINNTLARDESVVQRGHERVLRARLSDADFFFEEDRKRSLKDRLNDLKGVIFQAQLGTSYEKVTRFSELAQYLGKGLLPDELDDIRTVAELCKCDLVTQMVTEFPSLQGAMGREYARLEGYSELICTGIYEHYLPDRAGGKLPDSRLGAIVGLADRMDTICGYFVLDMEPSGTADPYALRRHAIAILRILEAFAWEVPFEAFIKESLSILGRSLSFELDPMTEKVKLFFRERYKHLMFRNGYENEYIDAVLSAGFEYIHDIKPRIEQVREFAQHADDFEAVAVTFKRIANMLKREKKTYTVKEKLFQEECEKALWEQFRTAEESVKSALYGKRYGEAMDALASLKEPVNAFFDGVEILSKDSPALRDNRIALLQVLARTFLSIADFSRITL